ncbi:uncharacterized protein BDR25DRAFT_395438 [Lindgomyces ingoldianus]|uniref:Uncharacterized protein n=1 Tax=Lindgomyces ingoldianus TaxID=673940 RepID=A0ACB6QIV0_9PLEO|nr:uncharacterized protein BDR25DRAFT_395438 [Lindgomyces ingoldianus]KAF2466861.1 hypothetical protein BDR25DRAFT_395438 [Lindgomyces ingoldianus]
MNPLASIMRIAQVADLGILLSLCKLWSCGSKHPQWHPRNLTDLNVGMDGPYHMHGRVICAQLIPVWLSISKYKSSDTVTLYEHSDGKLSNCCLNCSEICSDGPGTISASLSGASTSPPSERVIHTPPNNSARIIFLAFQFKITLARESGTTVFNRLKHFHNFDPDELLGKLHLALISPILKLTTFTLPFQNRCIPRIFTIPKALLDESERTDDGGYLELRLVQSLTRSDHVVDMVYGRRILNFSSAIARQVRRLRQTSAKPHISTPITRLMPLHLALKRAKHVPTHHSHYPRKPHSGAPNEERHIWMSGAIVCKIVDSSLKSRCGFKTSSGCFPNDAPRPSLPTDPHQGLGNFSSLKLYSRILLMHKVVGILSCTLSGLVELIKRVTLKCFCMHVKFFHDHSGNLECRTQDGLHSNRFHQEVVRFDSGFLDKLRLTYHILLFASPDSRITVLFPLLKALSQSLSQSQLSTLIVYCSPLSLINRIVEQKYQSYYFLLETLASISSSPKQIWRWLKGSTELDPYQGAKSAGEEEKLWLQTLVVSRIIEIESSAGVCGIVQVSKPCNRHFQGRPTKSKPDSRTIQGSRIIVSCERWLRCESFARLLDCFGWPDHRMMACHCQLVRGWIFEAVLEERGDVEGAQVFRADSLGVFELRIYKDYSITRNLLVLAYVLLSNFSSRGSETRPLLLVSLQNIPQVTTKMSILPYSGLGRGANGGSEKLGRPPRFKHAKVKALVFPPITTRLRNPDADCRKSANCLGTSKSIGNCEWLRRVRHKKATEAFVLDKATITHRILQFHACRNIYPNQISRRTRGKHETSWRQLCPIEGHGMFHGGSRHSHSTPRFHRLSCDSCILCHDHFTLGILFPLPPLAHICPGLGTLQYRSNAGMRIGSTAMKSFCATENAQRVLDRDKYCEHPTHFFWGFQPSTLFTPSFESSLSEAGTFFACIRFFEQISFT